MHGFSVFVCLALVDVDTFAARPAVDEGQSIVNSDCTGQITYNKGTPQELDINFLILHDGKELRGMLQNPGSAVQCDLIRMDASNNHDHD